MKSFTKIGIKANFLLVGIQNLLKPLLIILYYISYIYIYISPIYISPKISYQEKNLKNKKSLINPVLTMNYILLGASLKKRVLLRTSVLLVGMILFLMNGIRMYLLTKSVENGLMNQERGMKQQRFARSMGRCYLLTISLNNII